MAVQLANAVVQVNNEPALVIPNSVKYTEGFGEQSLRAGSVGGGEVEPIYSDNIESNFSMVSFEIPATIEMIVAARAWKVNKDQNVVQIFGQTPEGSLVRTFTRAALLNDYDVELGSETNITIEFKSKPAT